MEHSRREKEGCTRAFPLVGEMPLERKEADPSLVGPGPTPRDSRARREGQAVPDGRVSCPLLSRLNPELTYLGAQ